MGMKYWFINAFMEVDYTENPKTINLLLDCGNAFLTETEALAKLQQIRAIL